MADNETDDKTSSSVAQLNVSNIIIALHQNAIDKCKGKLGDQFRIRNSAISDDGDKTKIESAGEHIISVIPTEAAAKKKEKVIKKAALDALKLYVSWFVGPDLANKVNDNTVKSLAEAPGANAKTPKKDDNDKNVNEEHKPFMSFSQFLREADENGDEENPNPPNVPSDEDEGGEEEENNEENPNPPKVPSDAEEDDKDKKDKKDNDDTNDDANSSQLGYYITYEMNVKGLKKNKLEDSVKAFRKTLKNYFSTFFDDLTITASGIFGGGQSFTVKDVKSALRKTFGPIDPDELAKNVRERIEKKFSGSSPDVQVNVQDTKTLLSDVGIALKKKEKDDGVNYSSKISKSQYALFIKIDQDDPKKQILNRGTIANIVIASIPGIYKKLATAITKNDVIHIENYKDIHDSTIKIRKLYHSVPSVNELQSEISKAHNVNDAISKIENKLLRIQKNEFRKDCERADKCFLAFEKFKKANNTDNSKQAEKLTNITNRTKIDEFFMPFLDQYSQAFIKSEDKSLNESSTFIVNISSVKKMMLKMLFESTMYEDEQEKNIKSSELNIKQLIDQCAKAINSQLNIDTYDSRNFICNTKSNVKNILGEYDLSSFDNDFGEFKNAIVFCEKASMLKESGIQSLKDSIMNILFEQDADNSNKPKITSNLIFSIFSSKLKDAGIIDIASNVFKYPLKNYENSNATTNASSLKYNNDDENATPQISDDELNESTSSASNVAYMLPFGKDNVQPTEVEQKNGNDDFDYNKEYDVSRNDIYIVPIPKMKFEDPEFANKNL